MGAVDDHVERLTAALTELQGLFDDVGEDAWHAWARDCLRLVGRGDGRGLQKVRGAFGGMGSLNDLVIHPANGHRVAPDEAPGVNERLDELRTRLFDDVAALQRQLDSPGDGGRTGNIVEGLSGRVRFTVPDGWTVEARDGLESFAHFAGSEEAHHPSAGLMLREQEVGISQFCVDTVHHLRDTVDDLFVIDVDAWSPAFRDELGFAGAGRTVSYTHRSRETGARLRATDWLLSGGGLAIRLTTSTRADQWPAFSERFSNIADSIELTVGNRLPEANPVSPGTRDDLASATFGIDTERIHDLVGPQPYPFEQGRWLTGSTVMYLSTLAEKGRVGRFRQRRVADELAQLRGLGLVDGNTLTAAGSHLTSFLNDPDAAIRIGADRDDEEALFQVWTRGCEALVLADPFGESHDPTVGRTNFQFVPVADLSTLMARWVGLGPAWSMPIQPNAIDGEGLETSSTGRPGLPSDANPALRALWEEQWTTWHIVARGRGSEVGPVPYLNGGRCGHLILVPDGEEMHMFPAKSRTVFDNLEEILQATTEGRIAKIA